MDQTNFIQMLQTAIVQTEQSLSETRSVVKQLSQRCSDSIERHADAQNAASETPARPRPDESNPVV